MPNEARPDSYLQQIALPYMWVGGDRRGGGGYRENIRESFCGCAEELFSREAGGNFIGLYGEREGGDG